MAGIAPAKPSENAGWVRAWIADGRHGEMGYLADHLEVRLNPRKLLDGARSVICVADKHAESPPEFPPEGSPQDHDGTVYAGKIARYAFGKDYHKSMKKRLHRLADELSERYPGHTFRSTVDTAPILEREHAAAAGLGWIGKHTLLIHPTFGSYFFLGTIVTTLELETSEAQGYPTPTVPPTDHCGTCTRCIDACPTQCISNDRVADDAPGLVPPGETRTLDATRCISYLTLEHRSPIETSLHRAMGDWVAGCDVCQEVCPHNRCRDTGAGDQGLGNGDQGSGNRDSEAVPSSQETPSRSRRSAPPSPPYHPDHNPRPPAPSLDLFEVLDWTEEDRRRVFRGSALKRMKLEMIKRNALISLGNQVADSEDSEGAAAAVEKISALAKRPDEPELVRITAKQVLDRLVPGTGQGGTGDPA